MIDRQNSKRRRILRAAAAAVAAACLSALPAAVSAAQPLVIAAAGSTPPIAENLEYSTYMGTAVSGRLFAVDPDGGAVTFEISSPPEKGAVRAEPDGYFVYMPDEKAKGRDSFSYVAVDLDGNASGEAVVSVNITRQSTAVRYADMAGNGSEYYSLLLAEKGIFTGEKLGSNYFFRPDAPVTRGEFLAMCLAACGTETLIGVTRTGFSDDGAMPAWVKPYVSTGLLSGVITGFKDEEGRLVFAPDRPVTHAEAAVMLNKALRVTDVAAAAAAAAMEPDAYPAWAYQACINLAACRIMPLVSPDSCSRAVTRAEAAEMLASALKLIDERERDSALISWARQ